MSDDSSEWDPVLVLGFIVVFSLPLTLLLPNFSIWDFVPKVQVRRFHIISQYLTWSELIGSIFFFVMLFFCFYLEIKKRRMDEMVQRVADVNEITESTMRVEHNRQHDATLACAEMLQSSADHYEHLALLGDELRYRRRPHQRPPLVESITSQMQ